jgi:hypothetical protein
MAAIRGDARRVDGDAPDRRIPRSQKELSRYRIPTGYQVVKRSVTLKLAANDHCPGKSTATGTYYALVKRA